MPLFRVFLPPETLAPLPLPRSAKDYSPLRFQDLVVAAPSDQPETASAQVQVGPNVPAEAAIQQPWSLDRSEWTNGVLRSAEKDTHDATHVMIALPSEEDQYSWEKSVVPDPGMQHGLSGPSPQVEDEAHRPAKRRRRSSRLTGEIVGEGSQSHEESPAGIGPVIREAAVLERRRSSRLGRTSLSMFGTLPAGNFSESMLSLNTTASFPSQLTQPPLPKWQIPLSRLTPLHTIVAPTGTTPSRRGAPSRGAQTTNGHTTNGERKQHSVIVCVVSTEGPVLRRRKDEKAKGKDGTLWIASWRVIAPGPSESLEGSKKARSGTGGDAGCKVQLWDECARDWGAQVRKGDVVLLENAEFRSTTAKDPAHLSLSPVHSPKMTILYRTMPRQAQANPYIYGGGRAAQAKDQAGASAVLEPEDAALRPDLRLGRSDPGVRRVAELATWFAEWVGGVPPPSL